MASASLLRCSRSPKYLSNDVAYYNLSLGQTLQMAFPSLNLSELLLK